MIMEIEEMTPNQLADYYLLQSRRSGRTLQLVASLPNRPCKVIVHSTRMADYLKGLIGQYRPDLDIRNIRILNWYSPKLGEHLGYTDGPVYFDNAVLDMEMIETVRRFNRVYGDNSVNYFGSRRDDV